MSKQNKMKKGINKMNNKTNNTIIVEKALQRKIQARVAFASLHENECFNNIKSNKKSITVLISKDSEDYTLLKNDVKQVKNDMYSKYFIDVEHKNVCIKDGNNSDYEEHKEHILLKGTSRNGIYIANENNDEITDVDDIRALFTYGCFVNILGYIYVLKSGNFPAWVSFQLRGVQFVCQREETETFNKEEVKACFDVVSNVPSDYLIEAEKSKIFTSHKQEYEHKMQTALA